MGMLKELDIFVRSHLSPLKPEQVALMRARWEREKRKQKESPAPSTGPNDPLTQVAGVKTEAPVNCVVGPEPVVSFEESVQEILGKERHTRLLRLSFPGGTCCRIEGSTGTCSCPQSLPEVKLSHQRLDGTGSR